MNVDVKNVVNNTVNSLDKKNCTGCSACLNICPADAIEMSTDEWGYYKAKIIEDKCTNCGLCAEICPALTKAKRANREKPSVYELICKDKELLSASSSGGAFGLLAKKIFSMGGVVVGCAYRDDFSAAHIIIDSESDLHLLQKSKYFQSYIGDIFRDVKQQLAKNIPVLFTGTPCQVAGLYAYLRTPRNNLFTADLLCGMSPSSKFFQKYLDDEFGIQNIKSYEFRHKKFGWNADCVKIVLKDDTSIVRRFKDDSYQLAYHNHIMAPHHCANCIYPQCPRYGDISIGDFWGIKESDDYIKNGISVVLSNNGKGDFLLSGIAESCDCFSEKKLTDIGQNGFAANDGKPFNNFGTPHFYRMFNRLDFSKVVKYARAQHFDIGIYGWWGHENYGGILTYYALHETLVKMGYSVLMIQEALNITPSRYKIMDHHISMRFAKNHFFCSMQRDYKELTHYNKLCDIFIAGGDQVWNPNIGFVAGDNFLDFADDSKRKISYGSSLGTPKSTPKPEKKTIITPLLKRFDAISVREDYAVEMLREQYDVCGDQVVDAVFLLSKDEYLKIADHASIRPTKKYLLAYILDATEDKKRILEAISRKMNLDLIVIPDLARAHYQNTEKVFDNLEVLSAIETENFLYLYANAEYIVTDSYHGICFSYIFRKNFSAFFNAKRGTARFDSLFKILELDERKIEEDYSDRKIMSDENIGTAIDYSYAEHNMQEQVNYSQQWLERAVGYKK